MGKNNVGYEERFMTYCCFSLDGLNEDQLEEAERLGFTATKLGVHSDNKIVYNVTKTSSYIKPEANCSYPVLAQLQRWLKMTSRELIHQSQ